MTSSPKSSADREPRSAMDLESTGDGVIMWSNEPFPMVLTVQCKWCGNALPSFSSRVSEEDAWDGSTSPRYLPCDCQ